MTDSVAAGLCRLLIADYYSLKDRLARRFTQHAIRGIGETAYLSRLAEILDRWDSSGSFDILYVTKLVVASKGGPLS